MYQLSRFILGKRHILRADHQRNQEIAQHRRNRRDQEQEHHDDPVHGEQLVVGVRFHQIAGRRGQFQPDQDRENPAESEEERDSEQIQNRDPLVVVRQQPALQPFCLH